MDCQMHDPCQMITAASIAAGDPTYKKGFYRVGDEIYLSKLHAILACQKTGKHLHWDFNDEIYARYDWTQEPQIDLWSIYRARAQQLRNTYDYLVVLYSGGADSTNVLQSFCFNNIPIDEIMCYGPFSTTQGHRGNLSNDPENNYREIDLVAIPYLNELSKTYRFHVNLWDWTQDMAKGFETPDWIWTDSSNRFAASMSVRNKVHDASKGAMAAAHAGKKVGFVLGMDKPRVMYKDGTYQMAFLDLFMTMSVGPRDLLLGNDWVVDELFYWSPDMPELIIKQGHLIRNFFENNTALRHLIDQAHLKSWQHREEYYEICKAICYPYWNRAAFQTRKILNPTLPEHDNWYINSQTIDSRKNWLNGLAEIDKLLDPVWLHDGSIINGMAGTWSKFYSLTT